MAVFPAMPALLSKAKVKRLTYSPQPTGAIWSVSFLNNVCRSPSFELINIINEAAHRGDLKFFQ